MGTSISVSEIPDPKMVPVVIEYVGAAIGERSSGAGGFLKGLFRSNSSTPRATEISQPWTVPPNFTLLIDAMNLASVNFFLEHTAKLEGLPSVAEATEKSKWPNLPYWLHSIWLPLNRQKHIPAVSEVSGWPCLIGTAPGLLDDLNGIASVSPKKLGRKPKLFDLMLSNPRDYFAQSTGALSGDEILQWIWYAYKYGAEQSIARNMPLWQAG